jgi:Tfp pilus assembly protein PilN
MKAVNLIPGDERRGTGAAGRAGVGAYVVLGVLGALVVMLTVHTLAGRQIDQKRTALADARAKADRFEAEAKRLAAYSDFAALRSKRLETVTSLAKSRFDWADALHEVARTIPGNTQLTSLTGTVAPGVAVEGGGGGDPLRSSLPVPAFELKGCTSSQSDVARMISAMRRIEGVQRVSLSSSEKAESAGGGGGDTDCRGGSDKVPAFSMTVFFKAPAGKAAPAAAAPAGSSTSAPSAPAPPASATSASTGASK